MSRKDIAFAKREIKKYKKAYKTELRKIENQQCDENSPKHNTENPLNHKNTKFFTWINKNNKIHRDNKPAIIYEDGTHYWYKNGICHHDHQPAVIGTMRYTWITHGQYHSEIKPAIVWIGQSEYWKYQDKTHRINGFSYININPQECEIKSDEKAVNCHNEIYLLFVDGIQFLKEEDYVKACKEWLLKNKTAHECLDIFEKLEKNLKEGRFDKNNWHKKRFKPKRRIP